MNTEDHRRLRELLGAYVLDQLDADETDVVRAHLAGCAECRAEVAGLQPMAAALHDLAPSYGLDPAPAGSAVAPPDLGDQVLQTVRRRRRAAAHRARWRRAAGAVLVAASVATAFGVGSWFTGPRTDPPVIAVALNLDQPGLTADAGLVRHTWGTELKLEARGLTAGGTYAVTFVRDDGQRVSGGSFLGTGADPVRCSVNAALPVDDATELMITDASGALVMDARLR